MNNPPAITNPSEPVHKGERTDGRTAPPEAAAAEAPDPVGGLLARAGFSEPLAGELPGTGPSGASYRSERTDGRGEGPSARREPRVMLEFFTPTQLKDYRYATWSEVEALAQVLNVDPYWLASKERPAPSVPRARDVVWHAEVQAIKPKVVPVATPAPVPFRPVPPPVTPPAPPTAPPDLAPAEIPVLVPGGEVEFRRQMVEELARTLVKLGDTRLKPFEWRSWREHEKKIRAAAVGLVALPE